MLLYFLLFLPSTIFEKIESSIITENISFSNENITIHNLSKPKYYFHISIDHQLILPNYIKILVEQDEPGIFSNKYILSYYHQDSTFTKRILLSNALKTSYIWLNKEEIKNGFYLSVEAKYKDCKYKISIIPNNFIELNFASPTYSYFVTKENKNNKFKINLQNDIQIRSNDKIVIWVYGGKKVNVNLNILDYQKHSIYNAFIIKIKENQESQEYNFTVRAEIGDILDVGFMYLNTNDDCKNCINDPKVLYKGFLKRNFLTEICFKVNYGWDANIKIIDATNIANIQNEIYNSKKCIRLPKEIDELFFSYYYIPDSLPENNFTDYYLDTGVYYKQTIPEKKTVGYLPLRLEDNFEFITYNIKLNPYQKEIKAKAYISICNNFPDCSNDENIEENIPLTQNLDSYAYTMSKNEIENYINPMGNKRKLLFFKCEEGTEFRDCDIYINIYTDKTNIIQDNNNYINSLLSNNYVFIRDKNINNYRIEGKSIEKLDFINIEKISGEISIMIDDDDKLVKYKNIHLYQFNRTRDFLDIKIIAKRNSIYSIKFVDDLVVAKKQLSVGANYLLNLNNKNEHIYGYVFNTGYRHDRKEPDYDWDRYDYEIFLIYLNFYPINCSLDIIGEKKINKYKLPAPDNQIFYQYIQTTHHQKVSIDMRQFFNSDTCLIYVSSYNMNTTDYYSDNSLILSENFPQLFAFNEEVKSLNFSYYFSEINQDIIINITLFNRENYVMKMYINNNNSFTNKRYEFSSNKIIRINSEDLKDICRYENRVHKVFFNILKLGHLDNQEENSFLKITILNSQQIKENVFTILHFESYFPFLLIMVLISFSLYYILSKRKKKSKKEEYEQDKELIDIE